MAPAENGCEVASFLSEKCGDDLRSVVTYTADTYTLHYLRDDLEETWNVDRFEQVVDDFRMETLQGKYLNTLFQHNHGELSCRVSVFDNAIEMNFAIQPGAGLGIGVDRAYFQKQDHLVTEISETIEENFEIVAEELPKSVL